ncbi:MAG: RHS repeat-associated core domain-containing protein [Chloroflexota bacterium]
MDKPFGEVRSWWTSSTVTAPSYALTKYTFTGQYSYMDDPSTTTVTKGFGLMHYGARMYDPALGRFTSADTIVPGGVQGYHPTHHAADDFTLVLFQKQPC